MCVWRWGGVGGWIWAARWHVRLRYYLHPSRSPSCQLPHVPAQLALKLIAGSSPQFNPFCRGSPAFASVASYFPKSNRGSWLPLRPQEEGNIWGRLSSNLELIEKKHPGSDFLCSRILSWNPNSASAQNRPCCVEYNGGTV